MLSSDNGNDMCSGLAVATNLALFLDLSLKPRRVIPTSTQDLAV